MKPELARKSLGYVPQHAGYDPARYPGSVGVYTGIGSGEYQWYHLLPDRSAAASASARNLPPRPPRLPWLRWPSPPAAWADSVFAKRPRA